MFSMLYFFGFERETIESGLQSQKEFIWKNVQNEETIDGKSWNDIIDFDVHLTGIDELTELRQDGIPNGIGFDIGMSKQDIYTMAPLIDKSSNFDVFNEFNNKVYLTKCLLFAHKMNNSFQNGMFTLPLVFVFILFFILSLFLVFGFWFLVLADVKRLFSQISADNDNLPFKFAEAPIKQYERCLIKSSTDYNDRPFPSGACIVDFLRCSVTLPTTSSFLTMINKFIQIISIRNKDNIQDSDDCIIDIVRIKNGFNKILNWKTSDKAEYCDIKLNVLIYDKFTNQAQIGEVQFLVGWLLAAKKIGHKMYGIVRRQELIDNINTLIENDSDYRTYKSKIKQLINNNNINLLSKELIIKPNVMLSMCEKKKIPYLGLIDNNDDKLRELYFGALMHFSYDIIGNKSDIQKQFLEKYLNFNLISYQSNENKFVKCWDFL